MNRWAGDLALGVRLAVGGGMTSFVRLALTAAGMGLGVAVLLFASAVPTMLSAGLEVREQQRRGVQLEQGADRAGAGDLLGMLRVDGKFRGRDLHGVVVAPTGPDAPRPPGVERLPREGELVPSPALARLLDSRDGELLRPRFSERRIGLIGDEGLLGPHELFFYVGGATPEGATVWVHSFDRRPEPSAPLAASLWLMAAAGATALLVPVLVFVAATARIGAAARDRRLAAIRLVGADAAQARRIAAGEALVGGLGGVLVGGVLFLAVRPLVESVDLVGLSVFAEDVRPPLFAVLLVVLGSPALGVLAALFALRRVMLEPLGVVREVAGRPRRLSWRVLVVGVGAMLIAALVGRFDGVSVGSTAGLLSVIGLVLVVVGVPLLLPAVVERITWRLHAAGPPSWQLGIRRLQLDSGTTARVVGGVAALLVGIIALQSLMASVATQFVANFTGTDPGRILLGAPSVGGSTDPALAMERLGQTPGVRDALVYAWISMTPENLGERGYGEIVVGSCGALSRLAQLPSCRDGDVFLHDAEPGAPSGWSPRPGETVRLPGSDWLRSGAHNESWIVPVSAERVERRPHDYRGVSPTVLATPGGFDLSAVGFFRLDGDVRVDPADPDVVERVRNALAFDRDVAVEERAAVAVDASFDVITRVLRVAALVGLVLAAASMLVLSVEQVRERSRPLSMMVAAGCRRSTLSASLLWQIAVPMVVATVLAVGVGACLGALLARAAGQPVQLDWTTIGVLAGSAIVLVLAIVALTLPALRAATRPESLRTE